MFEKENKEMRETQAVFVLTIALTNFLLLVVLGVCFWIIFFVIRENHSLNAILRGGFLP